MQGHEVSSNPDGSHKHVTHGLFFNNIEDNCHCDRGKRELEQTAANIESAKESLAAAMRQSPAKATRWDAFFQGWENPLTKRISSYTSSSTTNIHTPSSDDKLVIISIPTETLSIMGQTVSILSHVGLLLGVTFLTIGAAKLTIDSTIGLMNSISKARAYFK